MLYYGTIIGWCGKPHPSSSASFPAHCLHHSQPVKHPAYANVPSLLFPVFPFFVIAFPSIRRSTMDWYEDNSNRPNVPGKVIEGVRNHPCLRGKYYAQRKDMYRCTSHTHCTYRETSCWFYHIHTCGFLLTRIQGAPHAATSTNKQKTRTVSVYFTP